MRTIKAILQPDPDGTLHLPLPPELRQQHIRVKAELEPVAPHPASGEAASLAGFGALKGRISSGATPQPGCLKGFWMAPDFDEPLEDFKEYME